jgi:large subunit ribosomal protein L4
MITATSINMRGEPGEKVKLDESIFGVSVSPMLLAQAVRVFLSNQRKANAKTKTRGEVYKTTAKMYRQKGTGRARHGSYSAPIFVGGGIAFGPKGTQNYKLKMSKQQANLALRGALSVKAKEQKVIVLSGEKKFSGKSKEAAVLIKKVSDNKGKILVITGVIEKEAARMFRNIEQVSISQVNRMNTYLVMANQKIMLTDTALEEMVKSYKKN